MFTVARLIEAKKLEEEEEEEKLTFY